MRKLNLLFLILFLFSGCSSPTFQKEITKSFNDENKAIKYGLNLEGLKEQDIIENIQLEKGEKIVLYKFRRAEGIAVGIGTIIQKNTTYTWKNKLPKVIIKQKKYNISANTTIKSHSNKSYELYLGVTNKENFTLKMPNGNTVTPNIDPATDIYYYLYLVE